jgi:uncharacterized cupredoxin-like copper-binding protein
MNKLGTMLSAALLALSATTLTQAHGDEHRKKTAAVKKEQKEWGIAGETKAVKRTITLSMTDNMRFTPAMIDVKQGETVKLVMKNDGKQLHKLVIGTKKELEEHAAQMLKFPNMEHDEPYMAHVAAGKTGEIIWNFNKTGDFNFACLIAGHYQAGMRGTIRVSPQRSANVKRATPIASPTEQNIKVTL